MVKNFLLFAVLIGLLIIPCYIYVKQTVRINTLSNYQEKATSGTYTIATSLSALNNLQNIVNSCTPVESLNTTAGDLNLSQAQVIIHDYLLPYDDCIAEAGLTFDKTILLTRKRIYYQRNLLSSDSYFSCDSMNNNEYVSNFSKKASILPVQSFHSVDYGDYEGLSVIHCWSSIHSIYLFATLPVRKIYSLVADQNVLSSGNVSVYYGNTLLSSSGTVPKEQYETIQSDIGDSGLWVEIMVPNSIINKKLAPFYRIVLMFFIIACLIVSVYILIMAQIASKPMNSIIQAFFSSKNLSDGLDISTPIPSIAQSIYGLDNRMLNYKDTINFLENNLRVHILEKALFLGLYGEEARSSFMKTFPTFPKRWRLALIEYTPGESSRDDSHSRLDILKNVLHALPVVSIINIEDNNLIVVLSCPDSGDPTGTLEELRSTTQKDYNFLFNYQLSEVHEDPSALASTYQQLEYRRSNQFATDDSHNRLPISLQQLQTIYSALSSGDGTAALNMYHEYIRSIDDKNYVISQYTYRMITVMLVMVKLESEGNLNDISIPAFNPENIADLFSQKIPECMQAMAERISLHHAEPVHNIDQDILDFINLNLSNSLLCINMITDRFHISAPTLQKCLHNAVNQSFSSYVEMQRMNKARNELRETGKTVQEISEDCGYTTPNSFYKAYKRHFNEAPLVARKQ